MYLELMGSEAAISVRISDDRTGAGLGVARQEEDCRELLKRLGVEVGEVYIDNDVSATRKKPRPAYTRLLADVKDGRWSTVAVWHTDRLTRSPKEIEQWIELAEGLASPVAVQTVTSGVLELNTVAFATGDQSLDIDRGARPLGIRDEFVNRLRQLRAAIIQERAIVLDLPE